MQPVPDHTALASFLKTATKRIAALGDASLAKSLPQAFRSAGRIVAAQAQGRWSVDETYAKSGFRIVAAHRKLCFNSKEFARHAAFVVNFVLGSADPDLALLLSSLGSRVNQRNAILSAFFHCFVAHEFLHIEQRLGSDQYMDSDYYLPIVTEADYQADISALVIAANANIPEIATLDLRSRSLLLLAIHIASMHSFSPSAQTREIESFAINRLAIWYLHFCRLAKSPKSPNFGQPGWLRSWVLSFPRLQDTRGPTTKESDLIARHGAPYPATADVVIAYHGSDDICRIHRASFTDSDRTLRLLQAIISQKFDTVREEFEELLLANPAMLPHRPNGFNERLAWQATELLDHVAGIHAPTFSGLDAEERSRRAEEVKTRLLIISSTAKSELSGEPEFERLCEDGLAAATELARAIEKSGSTSGSPSRKLLLLAGQLAEYLGV